MYLLNIFPNYDTKYSVKWDTTYKKLKQKINQTDSDKLYIVYSSLADLLDFDSSDFLLLNIIIIFDHGIRFATTLYLLIFCTAFIKSGQCYYIYL